ncbi:class F sortase [Phytoactinopolyspora alkaliphila]|uniref:Class F sortase n=1 Tax=Phytoactinopolyspora alkaliphila TaxID=1783498 RepID=A0A6N9YTX4_9ACTN|nr:class F sortase [Phytoactinopolyspora alkaliphila]NED98387.1 class F sortase [Phytoactinopolyspora alkaliphila]
MAEWVPRHRRRAPGGVVLYVVLGAALVLVAGAAWAVGALLSGGDSSSLLSRDRDDVPVEARPDTVDDEADDDEEGYRIWIPAISVTAGLVGIDSDDERVLLPPEDPAQAGWWAPGAAPGADAGTVLVVGHSAESGDAVFNHAGELSEDDLIVIGDAEPFAYRVLSVEVIRRDELPGRSAKLFTQDGPHRLVLVTCEGWSGEDFDANVVVTAEPAR